MTVEAGRLRQALLPLGLLLLLVIFVHSCVPKPITDLRPIGMSRVPATALPQIDDLRDALSARGESLWKVSLSGDSDWIQQVKQHELNSYALVVRCDERNSRIFSLGPYVGSVHVSYYGEGFKALRSMRGPVTYEIYLPETGRYISEADSNARMPSYDLGKGRTALCIRIAGGAMHGAYGQSNEVRVEIGGPT